MHQNGRHPRRRFQPVALTLICVGSAVLAGCSSGGPAQDPDLKEFTIYAPLAETGESPYQALIDAFVTENPEYTINLEETSVDTYGQGLTTKLQAGNAADVFEVQPGRGQQFSAITLAEAGYLLPLDDTSASTTVPAGSEDQFSVDGSIYAQGLDFSVSGIVTNLALMQQDGIPAYPATYDELLTDCGIAQANGHSFFTIAGSTVPNAGIFALVLAGDTVYGPDPGWNVDRQKDLVTFADSPGWKEALERFTEMKDAGCFQEAPEAGTFDTITNNLVGGASYAAAIPSGAAFGLGSANPDATFVVEPFPADDASDTVVSASTNYALAINTKSPAQAAAKSFLEFAASEEGAKIYPGVSGNLPVVGLDFTTLPPQFGGVADLLESGKTYGSPNSSWDSAEVYTSLGTGVQGIFTGQATVRDVLESMDAAW